MPPSIQTSIGHGGHSADVKMHLILDGQTLSISQLGPDFLILDTAIDHSPATARLFFSVDGNVRERDVYLPEGISMKTRRVVIANAR